MTHRTTTPRVTAPTRHVTGLVEIDRETAHRQLRLVSEVHFVFHRAGYLTVADGVTPASWDDQFSLSLLETDGLIARARDTRGDGRLVLTFAGSAELARLDAELFGAPTSLTCPECGRQFCICERKPGGAK